MQSTTQSKRVYPSFYQPILQPQPYGQGDPFLHQPTQQLYPPGAPPLELLRQPPYNPEYNSYNLKSEQQPRQDDSPIEWESKLKQCTSGTTICAVIVVIVMTMIIYGIILSPWPNKNSY